MSTVAVALLPLFVGVGCEAILHIGRIADAGNGSGNDAGGTGGSFGGAPDAATDNARPVPMAHPPLTSTSKLDLLFVIDDSSSMAPWQAKMRARIPNFMNELKTLPGGIPDLHVAVVSTSLGAGIYSNVPGCSPGSRGNLNGEFRRSPTCTQLRAGDSFISISPDGSGGRVANFTGDIADAFSCMADLGDSGCGFEHPFEATRLALQRSSLAGDANWGFLRQDAYLAIVMLANEDDCSVPSDSTLFDPAFISVSDPLGGLQSYRCNEFGHRCAGQTPPHAPPMSPTTFTDCVSNENGPLVSVGGFVDFLFSLKPSHPEKIFVGAIAGPPDPYVVNASQFQLPTGGAEMQPRIQHSCTSANGVEFADPAVRIDEWTRAFRPNSLFASICADDFAPVMTTMARTMIGQ